MNNLYDAAHVVQTVVKYKTQLEDDPIVRAHLNSLYDNLLEQNLCRIIEPYSRVQVQHVADLVKLPTVCAQRHWMIHVLYPYVANICIVDQSYTKRIIEKVPTIKLHKMQSETNSGWLSSFLHWFLSC